MNALLLWVRLFHPITTFYAVFHFIATVSIHPLERNVSRGDIECPGDTIPFNCSINSNSETVHLIWSVVLPNGLSINFTHDNTSLVNIPYNLNGFITSTLTQFMSDEYVESTLSMSVIADIKMNQTKLDCIIGNLDDDTVYVDVNMSGNKV